jgi:RNA polymerase sigma-70 factor (ECF subfamily)
MNGIETKQVFAARDGDREAYAGLVRSHLRRVYAICLAILGETSDAEDAAQEVFVRGFERIRTLRDPARFGPWIGQIARNRARDMLRSRTRRAERPLPPGFADSSGDAEDFRDLHAALGRLAEDDRLPLLLYYYDGKDTGTLADELGLSQGGACARLYRARRKLRALLEEEVPS